MKPHFKLPCTILATALAAALQLAAHAAVPVAWTNSPGMPPYPIKPVPHGSTVDLAVTLKGYTTPPIADGADVRLWYQTNGMGSAWWSAPATLDGSTITASFGPAQDCGADRVSLFFGAPSNVFASAVLRLTHAPGFDPARLPLPVPVLDFAAVELRNLSALTNGWSFGSTPGNYEVVSNAALKAAAAYKGEVELISCSWSNGSSKLLSSGTDGNAWRVSSGTRVQELAYNGMWLYRSYIVRLGSDAPDWQYTNTQSKAATVLAFDNVTLTRCDEEWGGTNYYPVVYSDGLPPAVSNVVTKSYIEDLGITSEEEDPVWSAEKSGYATVDALGAVGDTARAAQGTADGLSGRVSALETWAVGDETALSVTDAGTSNATLSISFTNRVMYSSAAERTNAVNEAKAYTDGKTAAVVSAVDAALAAKASRAWGETTSGGAPSPADTLYVEKRKVTITGGGNYAYLASSTGGYWVLSVSLGSEWTIQALADAQNPTNPATASLIDADGNAAWTVTSTGTRLAYAVQGQQHIYVEDVGGNDVITITYPITSDDHPTCLYDPECIAGEDMREASAVNFPDYIALVEWSGHSGEWVCRVTMDGKPGRGFFAAKYVKAGTVYTKYEKPLGISTVVIGNDTYSVHVETMNGKKVMVLEDL